MGIIILDIKGGNIEMAKCKLLMQTAQVQKLIDLKMIKSNVNLLKK